MIDRQPSSELSTLNLYLQQISKNPLLTREEEASTAELVVSGCPRARHLMIESNLRFVVSIAKRYAYRKVPLIDIIGYGNIGLIRAVDKFDPSKGFRFSTCAAWWIRESIESSIANSSREIHLPSHIIRDLTPILRAKRYIEATEKASATSSDIASILDIPIASVEKALAYDSQIQSFDSHEDDGISTMSPEQFVPSEAASQEECLQSGEVSELIQRWLLTLTEKQRIVIEHRFGLNNKDVMTLEELAIEFMVTRERVRQIQVEVIERFRKFLLRNKIFKSSLL